MIGFILVKYNVGKDMHPHLLWQIGKCFNACKVGSSNTKHQLQAACARHWQLASQRWQISGATQKAHLGRLNDIGRDTMKVCVVLK